VLTYKIKHILTILMQIYGELTGYAANADGYDVVAPSGVGGENCMKLAINMAGQ
jgi:3-oxoacyl-[acyl-carrier-protein] synthase-1